MIFIAFNMASDIALLSSSSLHSSINKSTFKHQCNEENVKYARTGKSTTKLAARDRHTPTNVISYNITTLLEKYDTSTQ